MVIQRSVFMFVYTLKIKWWRVVSFLLLTAILVSGIYYILKNDKPQVLPALPRKLTVTI